MFSMLPYDWANSCSAEKFLGVVSMVLVLWELVLLDGMGVEFQELDLGCIMFWIDHFILSDW